MSLESANKFVADIKAGKVEFDITKVQGVSDHDAAMKHVLDLGYDFTAEEMIEALNTSNFHGKKISMAGAEAVAGGSTVQWVEAGAGIAGGTGAVAGVQQQQLLALLLAPDIN